MIARTHGIGLEVVAAENLAIAFGDEGCPGQFHPEPPGVVTAHVRIVGVGFPGLGNLLDQRPDLIEIGGYEGANLHG